jgi:hypothetical protein
MHFIPVAVSDYGKGLYRRKERISSIDPPDDQFNYCLNGVIDKSRIELNESKKIQLYKHERYSLYF